jgi:hypothetical protein
MTRDELINWTEPADAPDPFVEEARNAGQKYIDSFKGDWRAIIEDLRRRSDQAGRNVVSLPPNRVRPESTPTKKAG